MSVAATAHCSFSADCKCAVYTGSGEGCQTCRHGIVYHQTPAEKRAWLSATKNAPHKQKFHLANLDVEREKMLRRSAPTMLDTEQAEMMRRSAPPKSTGASKSMLRKAEGDLKKEPLVQTTLLFVTRGDQVLLAMKKRGLGKGKWNGPGGKMEDQDQGSIENTCVRETSEEVGIHVPLDAIRQVGKLFFVFDRARDAVSNTCSVFVADYDQKTMGDPGETEEMNPQWFNIEEIPYDSMWLDDKIWLPEVLRWKPGDPAVTFRFYYGADDSILKAEKLY